MQVNPERGVVYQGGAVYSIEDLPYILEELYETEDEIEYQEYDEYEETIRLLKEFGF